MKSLSTHLVMMIVELLCLALFISLITATLLITFKKWNLYELYQIHKDRFARWLPGEICIFCIGFWISGVITFLFYLARISTISDLLYIAVPVASAALAKVLYNAGS